MKDRLCIEAPITCEHCGGVTHEIFFLDEPLSGVRCVTCEICSGEFNVGYKIDEVFVEPPPVEIILPVKRKEA